MRSTDYKFTCGIHMIGNVAIKEFLHVFWVVCFYPRYYMSYYVRFNLSEHGCIILIKSIMLRGYDDGIYFNGYVIVAVFNSNL